MRRILTVSALLSLMCLAPVSATPNAVALPDLFRKAKEQVKLGSFEAALSTLQEIESASQRTGLEKDREALRHSLAFYKGVCHAALGKEEEAREEFGVYLETSPNARLDPAIYPKRVIATFEAVQRSVAGPQAETTEAAGIRPAYLRYRKPDSSSQAPISDDWADGPVRFLLTPNEINEFRHMADPIARSEFITNFWKARDTKPETPENEFRDEFERRVAFADQYFVQGEKRGSYTDRGTIFVLLGPPARSVQRPMKTGEDTADPAALYLYTPGQVQTAMAGGGSRASQVARLDQVTGPGTSINQASPNWREVWRYFRKDLPGRLPYEWVDFDFITRPGYGEAVLQRDPTTLTTIERAKASLPRP